MSMVADYMRRVDRDIEAGWPLLRSGWTPIAPLLALLPNFIFAVLEVRDSLRLTVFWITVAVAALLWAVMMWLIFKIGIAKFRAAPMQPERKDAANG